MIARALIASLAAALVAATACANVLGIEDATFDPTFDPDGTGGVASMDDGGPTEEEASAAPTLCEEYCDTVTENCTDEFEVYTDRDICLRVCAVLPEGEEGDQSGNTVHCRLRNADLAGQIEPNVHCPFAGPGGNGTCGTNCEGYCTQMVTLCEARLPILGVTELQTMASCLDACEGIEDRGGYDTSVQLESDDDNIQCRLYHVNAAALDAFNHCEHAAGLNICKDVEGPNGADGGS